MKRKFFTTLAVFLSLALTACGGGSNSGDSKGGNNGWESDKTNHWHLVDGETVDKAKHDFEEDKSKAVAPTCEAAGKKIEVCKVCGYEKETTVKALGHTWVHDDSKTDKPATCNEAGIEYQICSTCNATRENPIAKTEHNFGEWVTVSEASCGEAGSQERECSICHTKETRTLNKIPHTWVVESTVAASGDGVEYSMVKCSKCGAKGLMVAAEKATLDGTNKGGPEGCIKLGKNGESMTVKINLAEAKTGVLYQRGSMDYWYEDSNNNQNKTYYSQNSGNTDAATKKGNFKVEVGTSADSLTEVELPDDTDRTFADMIQDEGYDTVGGHQWSHIADCEVGKVSLAAGLNIIKYTRVDSYNLAVHDFLVVFDA